MHRLNYDFYDVTLLADERFFFLPSLMQLVDDSYYTGIDVNFFPPKISNGRALPLRMRLTPNFMIKACDPKIFEARNGPMTYFASFRQQRNGHWEPTEHPFRDIIHPILKKLTYGENLRQARILVEGVILGKNGFEIGPYSLRQVEMLVDMVQKLVIAAHYMEMFQHEEHHFQAADRAIERMIHVMDEPGMKQLIARDVRRAQDSPAPDF